MHFAVFLRRELLLAYCIYVYINKYSHALYITSKRTHIQCIAHVYVKGRFTLICFYFHTTYTHRAHIGFLSGGKFIYSVLQKLSHIIKPAYICISTSRVYRFRVIYARVDKISNGHLPVYILCIRYPYLRVPNQPLPLHHIQWLIYYTYCSHFRCTTLRA